MTATPEYDLDALAALEAKATKGEWHTLSELRTAINAGAKHVAMVNYYRCAGPAQSVYGEEHEANAAFIAAARNALPAMIADLREAGALLEAVEWVCVRAWVYVCPCCKHDKETGRAADCRLDAWLKRMGRTK